MKTVSLLLLAYCLFGCGARSASSDTDDKTSYAKSPVAVFKDMETGCEYVTPWGHYDAISPRFGADGKQICTSPTVDAEK